MTEVNCPAKKNIARSLSARALFFRTELAKLYPDAVCALEFEGDPFRLLVMARLSAQCTDKRVNAVSVELFRRLPDVRAFAKADYAEVEAFIRSCGLSKMKAKNLCDMSRILVEKYNGEVPRTKEDLLSLPGVGEKIANLMLGDVFGDPHIVADTHCIRLAGRFGLTKSRVPGKVVVDLEKIIPKKEQSDFCHRIVLFGREFCRSQNPDCRNCPLRRASEAKK